MARVGVVGSRAGDDAHYDAFWNDLYKAGADIVLNGHDHDYERFAPQNPGAQADPSHSIREFVVAPVEKINARSPRRSDPTARSGPITPSAC